MEASSARSEAFSRQQLAVQRANLLRVCKMCIKSIVDKSTFEAISDDCPHLQNFCTALEHIFTHRLQSRWTLFGGNDTLQYWHVISHLAPVISVGSVEDMGEVQSELGKGRAWFHLSLVQKKLSSFMQSLLSRQEVLRSLYLPGAFLCSDELTELAGTLRCLDSIDFNLCLRGQDFNSGERLELSYFPYLQFQQSVFKDGRKGGRVTFTHLPMHTYHNHWEERLPVMEGPQSHSKEHQVGKQEYKWQPASDKMEFSSRILTLNLDTNTVEMTQGKTNASSFLIKSSNNSVHNSSGSRFQLEYLNTDDDSETQPLFGRQPHACVPCDCTPYQFYIHNNKSTETRNNGYHVIGVSLTEPLQC